MHDLQGLTRRLHDHRHQQANAGTAFRTSQTRGLREGHCTSPQGSGDQRWWHIGLHHQGGRAQGSDCGAHQERPRQDLMRSPDRAILITAVIYSFTVIMTLILMWPI